MARLVIWVWLLAAPAMASPPAEVAGSVPGAELRGAADVKFLGFNLYRAELWGGNGAGFALSLTYKRGFTAEELADASVKEIARMEGRDRSDFADLGPLLTQCFADVKTGDRITGASLSETRARFFYNGTERCDVTYPKLRARFFGIWLGEKTRDPKSRDRLLGRVR